MYEHINGIEKINILCTLLLILAGEYIFYYRYKKGTLEGISKIYFDINNSLSIIIVVSFSIIGIVFLLWELLKWILWKNYFLCICIIFITFHHIWDVLWFYDWCRNPLWFLWCRFCCLASIFWYIERNFGIVRMLLNLINHNLSSWKFGEETRIDVYSDS